MRQRLLAWCVVMAGFASALFGQEPPPSPAKLDPKTFDPYVGAYQFDSGQLLIISRTERRLYAYEPGTERIRGLDRVDDRTWVAGPSLLVYSPEAFRLTFTVAPAGAVRDLLYRDAAGKSQRANRVKLYNEEPVTFRNGTVTLAGTLLLPEQDGLHPAVVIGHGSGPQDRNGYASTIRIMADHLARHGIAALIYDKRGVGGSTGDWSKASFSDLAGDLISGIRFLRERADIDVRHVGIGGSSQIGWVAAKATSQLSDISFVFLVSAGGSGYSVEQQNLYNTEVEMRARGIGLERVSRVLDQQRRFFEMLHRGAGADASQYDRLARKSAWFTALEIDYDPLPAWRAYPGSVLGVFGELDAQTPVADVVPRFTSALMSRKGTDFNINVFRRASHLIMEATMASDDEMEKLDRFVPGFYDSISDWLWGRLKRHGLDRRR